MSPLLITGGILSLAGILLIQAADWTRKRLFRWSWYPVLVAAVAALLASNASGTRIAATLAVALVGGGLIAVAFISQKTGLSWMDVMLEMIRRQNRRKGRGEPR